MGKLNLFRNLLTFLIILNFYFSGIAQNQQFVAIDPQLLNVNLPEVQINKKGQVDKLSSTLNQLNSTLISGESVSEFIDNFQLESKDNRIVVTILPEHQGKSSEIDENSLIQYGAIIQSRAKSSLRVEIPVDQMQNIAENVAGIKVISEPIKPHEDFITSEGVALMNANSWHTLGNYGAGVKVAIIDGGFINLTAALSVGEIPSTIITQDFTGGGLEAGTNHGTAVAEAVHDVAPQAELYLYRISDITSLENAVEACIAHGVHVINHSMGWFNVGGYYNGTGLVCDVVNQALSAGILWANSAGNSALAHYRANFVNNGSGYHSFGGGNINFIGPAPGYLYYHQPGEVIQITLNWNNYPTTTEDYDLYLVRYTGSSWTLVASSTIRQNGSNAPQEAIAYTNPYTNGMYGVVVYKYSAATNVDFTLFSLGKGFSYYTVASSLTDPATITNVVTVGAIDRLNYASGPQESFSSQGPTTDGRIKPDVSAPDNCNSYTYGYWNGTSLSSPHTAGICALIRSANPSYSASDIRNYLYTKGVRDLGVAGKDNIYGWGEILLPPTAPIVDAITQPTCTEATGSVVLSGLPASGTWTLTRIPGGIAKTDTGTITTISGIPTGTYTFTVTNSSGSTSVPSANVEINSQPPTPSAPVIGPITQPTCTVATGCVVLNGLPAGNWIINPGNISGTGSGTTICNLPSEIYTFTVTNASGCTSVASDSVDIDVQPATPDAAGIITGAVSVCQGQGGVAYSVPAITGALGYLWTLPEGATITAGDSTNSITVDYSNVAMNGNVTVRGINACGSGTVSLDFPVIVNPIYNLFDTVSICQGRSFTLPDGRVVSTAGTYTSYLSTVSGCDSTIVTTLNVVNCIPLTQLKSMYCGIVVNPLNKAMACDAVAGATRYQWELTDSATGTTMRKVSSSSSTAFTLTLFTGIRYNRTYIVRVRAIKVADTSEWGTSCNVHTPTAIPLTQLKSIYCGTLIDPINKAMSCDAVIGATKYQYEITDMNTGVVTRKLSASSSNAFTLTLFTGIKYNKIYNVRVRAIVVIDTAAWGPSCTVNTPPAIPLTQLKSIYCGLPVDPLNKAMSCDAVVGATKYQWELTDQTAGTTVRKVSSSSSNAFTLTLFTGIRYNRTYIIKARAIVVDDSAAWGPSCTVSTPASIPLTQLKSTYCGTTIDPINKAMSCDAVIGATKYQWELTDQTAGTTMRKVSSSASAAYTLTLFPGIRYNRTYIIKARAIVVDDSAAWGTSCTVYTPDAIPLTQLKSTYCGTVIEPLNKAMSCDAVVGATRYQWELTDSATGTTMRKVSSSSSTAFTLTLFTGIRYNKTYIIRARAIVVDDSAAWGPSCTVYTPSAIPLTQLKSIYCGTIIDPINKAMSCDAVVGVSKYQWELTDDATGITRTKLSSSSSNAFTLTLFTGIEYNKSYSVRVRAIVFDTALWGPVCTVYTPATIPTTQLKATYCGTVIVPLNKSLSCDAVAAATGYEWEVTDSATGIIRTKLLTSTTLTLTSISGISYNGTYTVKVRPVVGSTYGDFGSSCTIYTSAVPSTSLSNVLCNSTIGSMTQTLTPVTVPGATTYQWAVTDSLGNNWTLSGTSIRLSLLKPTAQPNIRYYISVRAICGSQSGEFGSSCFVIQQSAMKSFANENDINNNSEMNNENAPIDVEKDSPVSGIVAFPNPANNVLTIEAPNVSNGYKVYITNLNGQVVLSDLLQSDGETVKISGQINLQSLSPGIYTVRLYNPEKVLYTKIVKR
jgi:hypothetical protein